MPANARTAAGAASGASADAARPTLVAVVRRSAVREAFAPLTEARRRYDRVQQRIAAWNDASVELPQLNADQVARRYEAARRLQREQADAKRRLFLADARLDRHYERAAVLAAREAQAAVLLDLPRADAVAMLHRAAGARCRTIDLSDRAAELLHELDRGLIASADQLGLPDEPSAAELAVVDFLDVFTRHPIGGRYDERRQRHDQLDAIATQMRHQLAAEADAMPHDLHRRFERDLHEVERRLALVGLELQAMRKARRDLRGSVRQVTRLAARQQRQPLVVDADHVLYTAAGVRRIDLTDAVARLILQQTRAHAPH